MKKRHPRAAALVVVLSVVVLLCLIIVSFSVAMRMERQAAYYFSERTRADFMAKEGVELAKIVLDASYSDTNNIVVSMPGQLMISNSANGGSWTNVVLASGSAAPAGSGILAPADLNRTNKTGDNLRQIDPTGGAMLFPWIYVYENGDRLTNAIISPSNKIIGRYAFWADDESSRINLNTAYKPSNLSGSFTNTNFPAHPSQISLLSIPAVSTDSDASKIYNDTKVRPLQSLGEINRILPSLTTNLSSNRFAVTTYNHSSDLNPWGEPKIVLTTKSNLANGRPFLDIWGTNQGVDPGTANLSFVDQAKFSATMTNLVGLLSRTNWPLFPGKSLAKKLKPSDPSRIAQVALDIISYVRSAESTNDAVYMMRVSTNAGGGYTVANAIDTKSFYGTARHPLLTEVGAWMASTNSGTNGWETRVFFEVYNPTHYGISSYPLTNNKLLMTIAAGTVFSTTVAVTPAMVSKPNLSPGDYSVVSLPAVYFSGTTRPGATLRIRLQLWRPDNQPYDDTLGTVDFVPDTAGTNNLTNTITTVEVDDPRNNKDSDPPGGNWVRRAPGTGNTLGGQNSIWMKSTPTGPPLQDTEGSGYSEYSLRMPSPKGQGDNPDGMVHSVAELGRVVTGFDRVAAKCIPWRTIRLQPSPGDTDIPDWVLLDLFDAPMAASSAMQKVYIPITNTIAGTINLNSVSKAGMVSKSRSLDSVFAGITNVSASVLMNNITNHTLGIGGRNYGSSDFYKSPGELAEVLAIADSGEPSEENLQRLVDLMTVQSSVFRVFAIGQSIKQTPTGTLIINATKSVETILETPTSGTATQFRSVSWRENPF